MMMPAHVPEGVSSEEIEHGGSGGFAVAWPRGIPWLWEGESSLGSVNRGHWSTGSQSRGQRDHPLLGPLAMCDPQQHPVTVDVLRLQVQSFLQPQPGGIQGGQDDPLVECGSPRNHE